MSRLGKPSTKIMSHVISRLSGAISKSTLVGSKPGLDVSVLRIDRYKVMVASCDPVSLIPSMGPEDSARMSAHEVASDVATSGAPARYAMIDLNLPPQISDDTLTRYWRSFHATCKRLGVSIVGGHTGRFEGCDYSVIGGATLWTFCGNNDYVTSMMAQDGDDLILTKGAGYGATSVLTRAFPRTARRVLGANLFRRAWNYFGTSNVVDDSAIAASVGLHEQGVTAMHDATEGGIVGGLVELAEASRLGGVVDMDTIPVSEETHQLCRHFKIDPFVSLGEGSLVIASVPNKTSRVLNRLHSRKIQATVIGRLSSKIHRLEGRTPKGRSPLHHPDKDPYWKAYWKAVRSGWS